MKTFCHNSIYSENCVMRTLNKQENCLLRGIILFAACVVLILALIRIVHTYVMLKMG